jgi:hypothetical protein
MPPLPPAWNPARRQLRHFAWLTALVVGAVAWSRPDSLAGLALHLLAGLIFAAGTVWPGLFRWPCRVLVTLIPPLALYFRVPARPPRQRRPCPAIPSCRRPRLRGSASQRSSPRH